MISRLVLVLDEKTGLPVWYDIIPGNVMDMNTIVLLLMRKSICGTGYSTTEVFGKTQSLMCCRNTATGIITVETPITYVKKYYRLLGLEVPAHVKTVDFMKQVLKL